MSENQPIYMEDEELCTIEIDEVDCSEYCDHIKILDNACTARDEEIMRLLNINLGREKIYKRAIATWGETAQINMIFEEMAELQKEICKNLRGKDNKLEIAEEIADVEIMLEQMKILFNIHEGVKKHKEYKIKRLEERLNL